MSFRRHLLKRMKGEKELPYIQLDYIESTGTQYIDTGYIPTINTDIKTRASVQYNSGSTPVALFGYLSGSDPYNRYAVQYHKDIIYCAKGKTEASNDTIDYTKMCDIETQGDKYIYNGIEMSVAPLDFSVHNKLSIVLFARRTTNVNRHSKSKIEFFKIYENGTLAMDLIPCIRKSDGVVCMYDNVSKSFFENEGTGSFVPGTLTNLPEGYAQVSYLESTGTQYIDTGVIYDTNNTYTISGKINYSRKTTFTGSGWNGGGCFGITQDGAISDGTNLTGVSGANKDITFTQTINSGSSSQTVTSYSVGGTEYSLQRAHSSLSTYAGNGGFGLFALYSTNTYIYFTSGKIYYYIIWDNGTIARYLVPCLDDENTPCMYDILNDKCYYNEGTGEFTYGKIIKRVGLPKYYQKLEYLESTGTQYIDIGLKVSNKTKVELVGKQYVAGSSLFGVNPLFVITSVQSTDKKQLCRFRYNNTSQDTDVNILELSKITFDKNKGYINDVLLATFAEATFSSAYNAILFGRRINSSGALEELTQQRIDYFKMWENDVLVRDMIPCLDENGRPCMYDMVNYKTYYNLGEEEFLYGIKEPTKNLIKETNLGFPSGGSTSISINSTYPYSYYMNDILLEKGKTYEVNVTYVRTPSATDDGTVRFRMLNEDGTFWGAPATGTYNDFFENVELIGKVGSSSISQWFSFKKAIIKPLKKCYMRPLVILGTKAKTPPCAYFVDIKEV